jgi:hypothetical protein
LRDASGENLKVIGTRRYGDRDGRGEKQQEIRHEK